MNKEVGNRKTLWCVNKDLIKM